MLNLRKIVKNYDDSARSYTELSPWMLLLDEGTVLCKDGSMLAVFEYDGVDVEGREQHEIDRQSSIAEAAMRAFDERITIWWQMDRRRCTEYPDGSFENPISDLINERWRMQFNETGQFQNRQFITVMYTPPGGVDGWFEKIAHFTKNEGMSLWAAARTATASHILKRSAFSYEDSQLRTYHNEFLNRLSAFENTMVSVGFERLLESQLLGFLYRRATPSSSAEGVKIPDVPLYLDSYLCGDQLFQRDDVLGFRGERDVFAAATSIKEWPRTGTAPGLLDSLMSLPGELTLSMVFRFTSVEKSRAYIEDLERHNRNSAKKFWTYMIEGMTKEESRQVDTGRLALADDAADALASISTENRAFGYFNFTCFTFGDTAVEADRMARLAQREMSSAEFPSLRETMHLMSCWAGGLPGQAGALVRWHFVSTGNLADLAPLRTLSVGHPINHHLTEQRGSSRGPVPAVTVLQTHFSTPYYFNFHQHDLAHAMVIGPSRTGKSSFMNFLISQFRKNDPCRVYIFDKDYSCRIATLLQGGAHIDLAGRKSDGSVKLNPVKFVGEGRHRIWLGKWVERLIQARGYRMTVQDEVDVSSALNRLAEQPATYWRLQSLASLLPKVLEEQLLPWVGSGDKARYFDNSEDAFTLTDFTATEMGGLFADPVVAQSFMDYAFYRIRDALDGSPTLIYVEEAWFMLADDMFAATLDDFLRTLAKKNAWLVLATQSLDELASSDIFTTLVDNIPTKIFLPNDKAFAHRDLYKDKFQLNEAQMWQIASMIPKRDYLIVTPEVSRVVMAPLPPEILASVRSDDRAQKVFDRHYQHQEPEWELNYIEEMVNG